MLKCVENCGARHPLKRVPCPDVKKCWNLLYAYKFFYTAKELYCDATIFVFSFFIVYLPKKNGNWKMVQGCRLSPTLVGLEQWEREKITVESLFTQYRHFTSKLLNNFSGKRLNGTIKEKRSGKRNCDTFATVLFWFRFVTPVPRKLDQTILFLSLSHLWLSRWFSIGN